MAKSTIGSQLQRAGDILRFGASNQIEAYSKRFQAIQGIYNNLLYDLVCQEFNPEAAVNFSRAFF